MMAQIRDSKHHVKPTSRRGEDSLNNEIYLDKYFHWAWHILFGNLFNEEVISIIENVWQDEKGRIREKYLLGEIRKNKIVDKILKKKGAEVDIRLFAWRVIFKDIRSAEEAIRVIEATFQKRT